MTVQIALFHNGTVVLANDESVVRGTYVVVAEQTGRVPQITVSNHLMRTCRQNKNTFGFGINLQTRMQFRCE